MILMRDTMLAWSARGSGLIGSYRMSSIRKRTRISRSKGSRCMSLARSLTALWSSEFTSLMIGASSSASIRSCGSWLISVASAERSSAASSASASVRAGAAVVDLVDRAEDGALVGELELELGAVEEQAQVVERRGVERDRSPPRGSRRRRPLERQHAVVLGEGDRHALDQGLVHVVAAWICARIGRPSWSDSACISSSARDARRRRPGGRPGRRPSRPAPGAPPRAAPR